jgi:hypothetical protein
VTSAIFSERFSAVVQYESVAKAARELRKDKSRGTIKSTKWSKSDGLLMFHSKIYVPNDRDLRCRIVEQHHDTRITAHAGHFKTLELVSCNYWWPQMSRYISIYVKHCQGTLAAVPMRANIRASALNKGGSGDPGAQSAVGHTA